MKTLLTGRKQALDFDKVDNSITPVRDTDYIREEKRKLKQEQETWDLLFSAKSDGVTIEDIRNREEAEILNFIDRFERKYGIRR